MRIVIALGGNALLRRGDPMTTEVQRRNIRTAARAIAPLAAGALLLGIPVYLAQRRHMTPPEPVPPYR